MAKSATITHRNTSSHTAEVYPTLNVDLLQIHGGGGGGICARSQAHAYLIVVSVQGVT